MAQLCPSRWGDKHAALSAVLFVEAVWGKHSPPSFLSQGWHNTRASQLAGICRATDVSTLARKSGVEQGSRSPCCNACSWSGRFGLMWLLCAFLLSSDRVAKQTNQIRDDNREEEVISRVMVLGLSSSRARQRSLPYHLPSPPFFLQQNCLWLNPEDRRRRQTER